MKFSPAFLPARLLTRYKRFLADIELPSGEVVTIHCPNTGSMKACVVANSPCWYSVSDNPKRKYPYTWEIATTDTGHLAGINTQRANGLVKEALASGLIAPLAGFNSCESEVKYGDENSRVDFLLKYADKADCYLEVKSVTLGLADGTAQFPDSVSARATKHLRELMLMVERGKQAALLFCVQHTGVVSVAPADQIDPVYGKTLREAKACGVIILAYRASISEQSIVLVEPLPVVLD